jgi:hypothetical protein
VFVVAAGANPGVQPYALAMAGGLCDLGSSVALDPPDLTCNSFPSIRVQEVATPGDPAAGLTAAEISGRTVLEVLDSSGGLVETESGFTFTALPGLGFGSAPIPITGDMGVSAGDGVLEVKDGYSVRAVYKDEAGNIEDPNQRRVSLVPVHCRPRVRHGSVVWAGSAGTPPR